MACVMLPVAVLLPVTTVEKLLLILGLFIVLIVEILNSAIEAVVDRFGGEIHPLSGKAKDLGSAAVLLALTICAIIWCTILFTNFIPFSTPEQQDGGIEPPPVLASRFFRFLNLP